MPYDATYENRDSRQQFYPDSFSPDILFDSFITYLKNNDNLVFAAYFEELRASLIMLDKNYRSYFLPVVDPGVEVIFPQFLFIFQLPPFLQMRLFAQIPYHIADN